MASIYEKLAVTEYERTKGRENIIETLRTCEFIDEIDSYNNRLFDYLADYLDECRAGSVIWEFEYIDKDYLEDYARYYSRCFKDYKKKCIRMHFFASEIINKKFVKDFISKLHKQDNSSFQKNRKIIQENYLGFVVLRPIPLTLFGRICLKTFPKVDKNGIDRYYPAIREYKVHLFGIELIVDALAFQEQDNAVSACATSALWVAFQKTAVLFHHTFPSPYEITYDATSLVSDHYGNAFPNGGLLPGQMANAIKERGLQPHMTSFINTCYLKAQIYSYLKCGIPVILGLTLEQKDKDKYLEIGKHAVTITGYNIDKTKNIPEFNRKNEDVVAQGEKGIKRKDDLTKDESKNIKALYSYSSLINKIYVHDDQFGPYAGMKFSEDTQSHFMDTGWYNYDDLNDLTTKNTKVRAVPILLLIPLNNKIRIKFDKIHNIINSFSTLELEAVRNKEDELVWEIYLETVCNLKRHFAENPNIDQDNRFKLLTKSFPKYIWIANAYNKAEEKLCFSFYFDATDIDNSDLFICSVHYDDYYYLVLKEAAVCKNYDNANLFSKHRITFHSKKITEYYKTEQKTYKNATEQKIYSTLFLSKKLITQLKKN